MQADEAGRYSVSFVGNVTKDGYTEYQIKVTDPSGESWMLKKRYREVRELHEHLKLKYPDRIPAIPKKRLFGNQDPSFIRSRQAALQQYLDAVLKLEPDCRTKALRKFLELENKHRVEKAQVPNQQQIIDWTQSLFIDLAQTPSSLDVMEIDQRVQKYSQAMRTYVLTQPIDPIHSQIQNIGTAPARFDTFTGDVHAPTPQDRVLSDTLQKLVMLSDKKRVIANADDLIARFPTCAISK